MQYIKVYGNREDAVYGSRDRPMRVDFGNTNKGSPSSLGDSRNWLYTLAF